MQLFFVFWKIYKSLLNIFDVIKKVLVPEEHVLKLHMQHILHQLQLKTKDFKMYRLHVIHLF